MDKWIRVKDETPKNTDWVLGYKEAGRSHHICYYNYPMWINNNGQSIGEPSHWMPLPLPPKTN